MNFSSSWSFIIVLTFISAANAVTVQQMDRFLSSGDKCLSHQLDRYIWVRGKDAEWKDKTFKERYQTALGIYRRQSQDGKFKTIFNGPWDRALVPVQEAQRDAIFDAVFTVDTTGSLLKGIEYDRDGSIVRLSALELYLRQNISHKLPNMIRTFAAGFGAKTKKLDELLKPTQDESYLARIKNTAAITAACSQLSLFQAPACVSATQALLTELNYNANMILPKIWIDFIRNEKLREGVRQSALLMLNRIKNKQPGRFFDDLYKGFQLAGLTPNDAREASWRLLALYGNGGANTGYRILAFDLPIETEVLAVGLSFIGTAVSYLDFQQRISGGQQYAFPAEVSGSCLTPKSYHFWLNAYLSRWLVKRGYSIEVAQMATFILDKGYQVNRDINNAGGGIEKLLSKTTDHPTNEVIRVDLVLAAAGGVYGSLVERGSLKPLLLEDGLRQLQAVRGDRNQLLQPSVVDSVVSDQIKLFKVWDQLYQPNEALRFFQLRQN